MKIAVVSDDGKLVSQNFDHALFYVVITVENSKMTHCELRHKPAKTHFMRQTNDQHPTIHHINNVTDINDCEVVLCGGMGRKIYESLEARKINPIMTDINTVGLALRTYLGGNLVSQAWRVHLFS